MLTTQAIALSNYEGWVAWVDGGQTPIFEHVPKLYTGLQLARGFQDLEQRPKNRNVMDWWELPHDNLQRVEVYFDRQMRPHDQPVILIEKGEGADLRFFQFKFSGIVAQACGLSKKDGDGLGAGGLYRAGVPTGQQRLGVRGYFLGYWNRRAGFAEMVKVERGVPGAVRYEPVAHPCWPKPLGYGLAPHVVGLTAAEVPTLGENGNQPLVT